MLGFLIALMTEALIFVILVVAINISWGYSRLLNFGLVGFFTAAAYAYAVVVSPAPSAGASYSIGLGLPPLVGILGAILVGGFIALLIGLPTIRLKGHHVGVATFGLATVILTITENEAWATGGVYGIIGVSSPLESIIPSTYYSIFYLFFSLSILLLVIFLVNKMMGYPYGTILTAIGDDELAAKTIGKSPARKKLESFIVSGMVAGLAGALYVGFMKMAHPSMFYHDLTFLAWVAMIIGGSRDNRAVALGGIVVFAILLEGFRIIPISASFPTLTSSLRYIIIGIIFIAVLWWKPDGLFKFKEFKLGV